MKLEKNESQKLNKKPQLGTLINLRRKEKLLNKQASNKIWKHWENRRSRKIKAINYFFIVLPIFIAFFPILQNEVLWTDYDSINRSFFTELPSLISIFNPSIFWNENPLALTTYFAETLIPLNSAFTHRAINLILHALASILLYRLLNRMHISGALITTLFFAVHPVAIQTLFWPGFRDIIIILCLILLSLYLALERKNKRSFKKGLYLSAITSLIHPIALLIPITLFLNTFTKNKEFKLEKFNKIIPFIIVVFILSIFAEVFENTAIQQLSPSGIMLENESPKLVEQFNAYLKLLYLPFGTAFFIPIDEFVKNNVLKFMPIILMMALLFLLLFLIRSIWARLLIMGITLLFALILNAACQFSYFLDGTPCLDESMVYIGIIPAVALVTSSLNALVVHKIPKIRILWFSLIGLALLITTGFSINKSFKINNSLKLWEYLDAKWTDSVIPKKAISDYLFENGYGKYSLDNHIYILEQILEKDSQDNNKNIQLARLYVEDRQFNNASKIYKLVTLDQNFSQVEILNEAASHFELQGLYREARNIRAKLNKLSE